MRKHYVYAMTLIILLMTVCLSYYFYLELCPQKYKNGTFVEIPHEVIEETWELTA